MKRNIYIFIVLSLALALPSCKIGKKYALPELDLPEEIVAGADTASIDSISCRACMSIRLCNVDYHRSR